MDVGIPYVIASQWLYAPHFFEYRGGLFRSVHPGGLIEDTLQIVDDWYDAYGGDISRVERTSNSLTLWSLFVGSDIDQYDEDLSGLAKTLARVWDALLRAEFPDRSFHVEVWISTRTDLRSRSTHNRRRATRSRAAMDTTTSTATSSRSSPHSTSAATRAGRDPVMTARFR
jgi:hypothetical protein